MGRNIEKSKKTGIINKQGVQLEELGSLSLSNENLRKLVEDEQRIVKEVIEYAIVYDKKGNVLFEQVGELGKVKFTKSQVPMLNNAIVTHNHVRGGSFSPGDIWTLKSANLAEVRACTFEGTYIMT